MFEALKSRQPGAPVWRIIWWYAAAVVCLLWMGLCFRYRAWGTRNIPASGPVLLVSNHQSYLDPILVGLGSHRRQFFAMARLTLFKNRFFAWLIDMLNAIPVDRGNGDKAAMRRAIELLGQGHALLIFPEGTRTLDGAVKAFQPGTMLLIKRARPAVVPVAVEGSFAAWPKGRVLPKLTGRVRVSYGRPIPAEKLISMGAEGGMKHLQGLIEGMRQGLANEVPVLDAALIADGDTSNAEASGDGVGLRAA